MDTKMKFGKEFAKQMVPEWKGAYMDYSDLKRLLKEILHSKQSRKPETPAVDSQQMTTLYRSFSGLTRQFSNLENLEGDIEEQVIAVNTVQHDGSKAYYETKFLMPADGGEHEIMFFRRLDAEFNKVDSFYRDKVKDVMDEAAMLNKQMDALIALRIKVENPDFNGSDVMASLSADIGAAASSRVSTSSSARRTGHMDSIEEVEICSEGELQKPTEGIYVSSTHTINSISTCTEKLNINSYTPPLLEVLERVKISNTLKTPISTIKGVLNSKEEELRFRRQELRKVEEQLKLVFIEFYQKLLLLQRYSYMNLLAFSKIMKKYDKITSRRASRSYLNTVDNSYLGSSEEVTTLLERVEATVIKYFSNSNRRKGMKYLRPKARREKHSITFLTGFLSGCAIALLVALMFIVHHRNKRNREEGIQYMENILPLYSLFAFIVLHMLLYAANIYFWRRYRVNYQFILNFKLGTELGHREVFLLSAGLSVLALASVLANFLMEMDSRNQTQNYETLAELIPLGLLGVLLFIIFCPFNVIYRSSRFFLLQCLLHCICAPIYKVTLPDFFLADNITSQVQSLRSLGFYICYYAWGDFTRRQNKCHDHDVYRTFYFIVEVIPFWTRFLQCLRRLFDEKDAMHGFSGLKYFLTIFAIVMRTTYDLKKGIYWKAIAVISYTVATTLNTFWDIFVDWGLLRRCSKNRWLRDQLLVSHKSVYYIAMVLNILLRFAWVQLMFQVPSMDRTATAAIFSCLEILRRGIWSFFRLENEHLNNVGRYRAFKSVPLPFIYYDEGRDKDEK